MQSDWILEGPTQINGSLERDLSGEIITNRLLRFKRTDTRALTQVEDRKALSFMKLDTKFHENERMTALIVRIGHLQIH